MKTRKVIREVGGIVGILIIVFLVYSLVPRVFHTDSSYGRPLTTSEVLSFDFQDNLKTFIEDTASRMQNVLITHNGEIVFETGDTKKLINCHSARKSIMSILIGIAVEKGLLSLDETLESIGIDESRTPLTNKEKSATIRDLLMCTSGIFLKAEAEHTWAGELRPQRGTYAPGEYFFYNNFDFNVLGAILEKKTGMSIGHFMEKYLAIPLEFQDFSPSNIVYNSPWPVPNSTESDYPVYWIYLSTRDFAKIGILITQNGVWNKEQVVSEHWIKESLKPYSKLDQYQNLYQPYEAFAYSWWLENDTETIWADGYGGQFLCIDPNNNIVVVQRNFTGNSLLSSGLFLLDENRDNNPKSDLIHVYDLVKEKIEILQGKL